MTHLKIASQIIIATLLVAQACSLPSPSSIPTSVNVDIPLPVAPSLDKAAAGGSYDPRHCSTGCQPKNSWKETSCFPKAYCSNIHEDFINPRLANSRSYKGNPYEHDFTIDYNTENVRVDESNLKITMKLDRTPNSYGRLQGLGSVVSTTRFIQYGKVKARIKTGSASPGVVSAFIIRNEDPGDEIDFEIVGRDPSEAQTNFYYRTPPDMPTELIDYSNTGREPLGANTALGFHEYEIEWMPDYIQWKVDGRMIRRVFKNETKDDVDSAVDPSTGLKGKRFPSTPAQIQFGIWDGGQGPNGTAAWAGSPTDWSKPDQTYEIQVDYVDIECYYSGNETQKWPPPGYGPTILHDGPYNTPGLSNWSGNGGSTYNEQEPGVRPFVPFYKNYMLMIPTGCFLGLALIIIGTVQLMKRRRLAQVRWT
ncbi:hypothetical protein BGZ51_002112 [Haplosporangium sp. Z 767]|nr:hypothetical protein BGZ51_002112 [Haplosporangium sp. Z 767]